jgi:hypothetical protein
MRHSFHLLANVLALMIVFFYRIGLAILMEVVSPNGDDTILKVFGALLIVYGIFRLFRLYLNLKNRRNEE